MKRSSSWPRISSSVLLACVAIATSHAQTRGPSARLASASRLDLPGEIDSSNPAAWSLVDGVQRLFVISSWGGIPVRSSGASLESLQRNGPVAFSSHPGHGVWMEAIVPDAAGVWDAAHASS